MLFTLVHVPHVLLSLLSYSPQDHHPRDVPTQWAGPLHINHQLRKCPTDWPRGKSSEVFLFLSHDTKLSRTQTFKYFQVAYLQRSSALTCLKDVKSLISHQLISKQKQNKKVVELRQITPKDVMAYLYLPHPHDMPIFTLLLSTNASTCQDPSDPASWQMKDCQRQH